MASKNFTEVKVIQRGEAYVTPLQPFHLKEINIHEENLNEFSYYGYEDVDEALEHMSQQSEAYICRNKRGQIIFICGLWFEIEDDPQMFMILADNIPDNVHLMAKMSIALLHMFEMCHLTITMSILAKSERMLHWACWLGFAPVGTDETFVDFVRCNITGNSVTDESLRPVTH